MKIHAPAKWLLYRWLSRRRRPSGTPYRPVGIYKADRLGDFVLALGAIRNIIEKEGRENCLLILTPHASELADREFPTVAQAIIDPFRFRFGPLLGHLRSRSGDDVFRRGVGKLICLRHHRQFRENIVIGAIPAGETWGANNSELCREPGQWLSSISFDHTYRYFPELPDEPRDLARHRTVVGGYLGLAPDLIDIVPRMAAASVGSKRFASVSPFGRAAIRTFPYALLASAGRYVWHNHRLSLRLLAPPDKASRCHDLANRLIQDGVSGVEVMVCVSLENLIEAVSESSLVLSVETATAHLATALDRPMVALLGGGHYGWFAPWVRSNRQKWLTHSVPCFQCNWLCCQSEPGCMTRISEVALQKDISEVLMCSGD